MPVDRVYHGTNWFVDPQNYMLYRMEGNEITNEVLPLSDLTNGTLSASGGFIRETATGRIIQSIPIEYPPTLSIMPEGQALFRRETSRTALNTPTASESRYGAVGTADLVLPSGETRSVDLSPWLSGEGERVLVKEASQPGEEYRFQRVHMFDEAGNQIEPEVPPGYRFATPEEALHRGMARELIDHYADVLKEMVDLGMTDQNGAPITSLYEAAIYVSTELDVNPYLSAILPA